MTSLQVFFIAQSKMNANSLPLTTPIATTDMRKSLESWSLASQENLLSQSGKVLIF